MTCLHVRIIIRHIIIGSLPPKKEPYEYTDLSLEPQKESTDYETIALNEPPSVLPTGGEYDSVYATPADVQRDADFDHQIPSINPVTKGDFWSYVNSKDMKAFQQEFRVMNPCLITVSLIIIAFKFKADNNNYTLFGIVYFAIITVGHLQW